MKFAKFINLSKLFKTNLIFFSLFYLMSCGFFEKKISGEDDLNISHESKTTRFSEQNKLPNIEQRQYIRMTRERLEKENELYASAGSMWSGEGQSGYLFSQNKIRKEGDLLNIKLEGSLLKQVQVKVSVIERLLEEIEKENKKYIENNLGRKLASNEEIPSENKQEKKEEQKLEIEMIPAKIIEILSDGNYRIRGQQKFMLKEKEFKVLITGIVRPDDLMDELISSNRILDPEMDVLSSRQKNKE